MTGRHDDWHRDLTVSGVVDWISAPWLCVCRVSTCSPCLWGLPLSNSVCFRSPERCSFVESLSGYGDTASVPFDVCSLCFLGWAHCKPDLDTQLSNTYLSMDHRMNLNGGGGRQEWGDLANAADDVMLNTQSENPIFRF